MFVEVDSEGISGRFPAADNMDELQYNLEEGVDMIDDPDVRRWPHCLWGLPGRAGRIKDLSKFDSEFFGYSKQSAHLTDHQLRILYEVVYESIADSGVNPASLRGTKTGLFLGLHTSEFDIAMHDDPKSQSSGYSSQLAVKLASYFDFRGQVSTFDSACSSGFVALHSAVTSLKLGMIDQAVVCASNISIHPANSLVFVALRMLSPTGYSRFLDSHADGYVKSEACSAIFLQRESVSLRRYASILAINTNSDGFKHEGITFPSSKAQEILMRKTKEMLGIHSNDVKYFEFHGTGTPAGDPQEARAVSEVYCSTDSTEQGDQRTIGPLLVGSVKTNLGHSEGVSGLCSLAKVILMFENDVIYKSLHYTEANPNILSLVDGRIKVVDEIQRLQSKIVPINCYGFGGTNVHGIFQANPRDIVGRPSEDDSVSFHASERWRLILMFGRSKDAVLSFFDSMMSDKTKNRTLTRDFLTLVDSLCKGPIDRLMKYRGYLLVDLKRQKELHRSVDRCDLLLAEDARANSNFTPRLGASGRHFQEVKPKYCYFIYSGLSSSDWARITDFANNTRDFDIIWSTIEKLHSILEPLGYDLIAVLRTKAKTLNDRKVSIVDRFVAVTAIQIALTNLLKSNLNIIPTGGLIGHCLGEIPCAYAAGTLNHLEAILLAYHLAHFLHSNEQYVRGSMISLNVGFESAQKLIESYHGKVSHKKLPSTLYVSFDNGPEQVIVSSREQEMKEFVEHIEISQQNDRKILYKVQNVRHVLHNPYIMDDSKKSELVNYLDGKSFMHLSDSHTEGLQKNSEESEDSVRMTRMTYTAHLAHSLCNRVCFRQSISRMMDDSVLIQIGQFHSDSISLKELLPSDKNVSCINLMMNTTVDVDDDRFTLFSSIGKMFMHGLRVDLSLFYPSCELPVRRRVPSISSLVKWDHSDSFFLPKYPDQFSCTLTKSDIPIDITEDRYKYLIGHSIDGRVLYPATGYLYQIWRIFSNINNGGHQNEVTDNKLIPVEFHDVRLFRAVMLTAGIVSHLSIILERGTGKFEINEGDSTVMTGKIRSPDVNPGGLLYEDVLRKMRGERFELSMDHSDVYRQFRLCGYDYGETFSCIQSASSDGRFVRIKYNGKLVSLTDNVLQAIFLALSCQSPVNSLLLPTGFDYVRFNPAMIFEKINRSTAFRMDESIDEARMMGPVEEKITSGQLERLPAAVSEQSSSTSHDNEFVVFDTFCELATGITVSDGIEIRGVKATLAPRRESIKPQLECYNFIPDVEEPVRELVELCKNSSRELYCRVCTSVLCSLVSSMKQLAKSDSNIESFNKLMDFLEDGQQLLDREKLDKYLNKHLEPRRCNQTTTSIIRQHRIEGSNDAHFSLLALLDSLSNIFTLQLGNRGAHPDYIAMVKTLKAASFQAKGELHKSSDQIVNKDFILSSFNEERFIRPIVETIVENCCQSTTKLSLFEINSGDNILYNQFKQLVDDLAPNVSLNYTLAHADHHRLNLSVNNSPDNVRRHTLNYVDNGSSSLLSLIDDGFEVDALCYYDSSCYSPMFDVQSDAELRDTLLMFKGIVRRRGFLVVMTRHQYTLAELFIMALGQLDTTHYKGNGSHLTDNIIEKMVQIQANCRDRVRLIQKEAVNCCKMVLTAKKMDTTGCTIFMFQNDQYRQSLRIDFTIKSASSDSEPHFCDNRIVRVKHGDNMEWLDQLKEQFFGGASEKDGRTKLADYSRVWLCFVATKNNPINGIVGLVQCLRKELGSCNVRCFFDCYTFKTKLDSEVCLEDILVCRNFVLAIRKDMLWNCIDSSGAWGSFRHLSLNEYFDYVDEDEFIFEEENTKYSYRMQKTSAYADVSTKGDLSSFKWHETPFSYLSSKEREQLVEVHYSSLNFRDIMLATGRLPADALPGKMAVSGDCLLGLEFSGLDTHRNKRVAGMLSGRGIATHVLCPDEMSIKFDIPESMSMKEAATIPVVYATAIMALIYRGKMKSGETVLIHAGSGGVGQAAIRLAIHHNVKVFTTVGGQEKRNFLLKEFKGALESDQIFDSRDCSFEEQILRATNGRGVDLILNSLAEDKLQASLRCLANNGRFLEIGKYDLAINNQLELLRLESNKSFHGILLDKLFEPETMSNFYAKQLNCVVETLADGLKKGYVKPIRYTCFTKDQLEPAFRYMATGKHIGKVLIEIKPEIPHQPKCNNSNGDDEENEKDSNSPRIAAIPKFQLDPNKSYIITGGLGGFGLELVKWLACVGGKRFVLTSRTGLTNGSSYKRSVLERLKENLECEFLVVNNDMADGSTLEGVEIIFDLAKRLSPVQQVGGVFHLAVVLKDSLLEDMTSNQLDIVYKPKAQACIFLDEVSRKRSPEMPLFVTFSSISCGKGNAGQTNYGYANSILERVCERRRKDNLHGLAIQWGPIGDVGLAYEKFKSNDIVLGGLAIPQRINSCLAAMAKLLCTPFAVCSSTVKSDDQIRNGNGQGPNTNGGLTRAVLNVLGVKDASKISNGTSLGELGLDSLMAVEIRQYIEREYQITLNVQEIRSLTIQKIKEMELKSSGLLEKKSQCASSNCNNKNRKTEEAAEALVRHIGVMKGLGLKFNSAFDSGFKPQLNLPKTIFFHLNNSDQLNENRDPIFFLTNIHGDFERLKSISVNINRPCIGLNWTKEFSRANNFLEAASFFVDLLEDLDWMYFRQAGKNICMNGARKTVDIVGYSFGATLSFEILLLIQNRRKEGQTNLVPGGLILLDMSPKLTESLGDMSGSLFDSNIDEVLAYFIAHHAKHLEIDFQTIKNRIASVESSKEAKFILTCEILSKLLNFGEKDQAKRNDLLDAIIAFFKRYEILFSYKVRGHLEGDVTLLRSSEKIFTIDSRSIDANDYCLSEVVAGAVNIHVFDGDHETFIDKNIESICEIVNNLIIA